MNTVHSGIDEEEKVVWKQTVFTVMKVHPSHECASAPPASGLSMSKINAFKLLTLGLVAGWVGGGGGDTCV